MYFYVSTIIYLRKLFAIGLPKKGFVMYHFKDLNLMSLRSKVINQGFLYLSYLFIILSSHLKLVS